MNQSDSDITLHSTNTANKQPHSKSEHILERLCKLYFDIPLGNCGYVLAAIAAIEDIEEILYKQDE